ncbi:MAG: hypothetical protein NDI82_01930 [Anaeromyxobacteraceae bacterium]|nr:hypothetical protein [Anaeromyxobacteraceae bacterium]
MLRWPGRDGSDHTVTRSGHLGWQYAHCRAPRYRELAEAHRAAAGALRDEQVKACRGVPADEAGTNASGVKSASVDEIRQGTVPPVVHSAKGYYPQYLLGARLALQGGQPPARHPLEGLLPGGR